jgi:signal recognition particle GTPase
MRQGLMDSMSDALFGLEEGTQRIMVLSGMGGSGKTQIVAKFARVYSSL